MFLVQMKEYVRNSIEMTNIGSIILKFYNIAFSGLFVFKHGFQINKIINIYINVSLSLNLLILLKIYQYQCFISRWKNLIKKKKYT